MSVGLTAQTRPAQTAKPGSLALTVVDEKGAPLSGATVTLHGAVDRRTISSADGVATLLNIPAGVSRVRVAHDGFHTLEKEVTIRAAARATAEASLSAAPAPKPPPPPPPVQEKKPAPSSATGPVGTPLIVSIPDLAEQLLKDQAPIVERELGCSSATAASLILIREPLTSHTHTDADEVLYVVAGDATLRLSDRETNVSPGWFGLVPRGTSHAIARRGRNAPIVLSVRSGPPCGSPSSGVPK